MATITGLAKAFIETSAFDIGFSYQSNGLLRPTTLTEEAEFLSYSFSELTLDQIITLKTRPKGQDLVSYLPSYMQDGNNMRKIQQIYATELDRAIKARLDVFRQMFVETATWGLAIWERQLLLPINPPNVSYEQRRATIRAFLGVRSQVSEGDFVRRISELLQTNVEAKNLNPSEYPYSVALEASSNIRFLGPERSPVNEVQSIDPDGTVLGGTYTLEFAGSFTDPLPFDADAAAIEDALIQLPAILNDGVRVQNGPLPRRSTTVEFLKTNDTSSLFIANTNGAGSYKINLDGVLSATIAPYATAATITSTIEAMANVGAGNVLVTGYGGTYQTGIFYSGSATPANGTTRLVDLKSSIGASLGIVAGDVLVLSFTSTASGTPYNANLNITSTTTLEDLKNFIATSGTTGATFPVSAYLNSPGLIEFNSNIGTSLLNPTISITGRTAFNTSSAVITHLFALNANITFVGSLTNQPVFNLAIANDTTSNGVTVTKLVSGGTGGTPVPLMTIDAIMSGPGTYEITRQQAGHNGAISVVPTGTGLLNGSYVYKVKFVYLGGETDTGSSETDPVTATNQNMQLNRIPVSNNGAVARRIFRRNLAEPNYYLVATLNDDATTSYLDTLSDDQRSGTTYSSGFYGSYTYELSTPEDYPSITDEELATNNAYNVIGRQLLRLIELSKPAHIHVYLPGEGFRAGINSAGDPV